MIQRIQTLYLIIVFAMMATLLCVPIAQFIGGTEEFSLTTFGIRSLANPDLFAVPTTYMGILAVFAMLIPLITIFLYRKRWLQIRLCIIEMVLLAGLQVFIIYYLVKSVGSIRTFSIHSMSYSFVDIFPIAGIVFMYLAFRGIARDETLVRSLDRIR